MNHNLTLEIIRVTEATALSVWHQIGKGDEKAADQAAVDAMRNSLNNLDIDGTVVIGEGERDKAPMLYIGEKVGKGGPKVDIALDPLEGTTITAKGGPNALAVIAMAEDGGFLHAPDVYMEKIAIGEHSPSHKIIDINASVTENLHNLAKFKNVSPETLVVCVLDRPRHQNIIHEVRNAGARIALINDGDVSAVIATATKNSGIDMYIGTGGAPEGVLAAAALRCLGGQIEGRLVFNNDDERKRAKKWGITDLDKIYNLNDLASGDVLFAATGVTDGQMLQGVKQKNSIVTTHSLVMCSKSKDIRHIKTVHGGKSLF